MENMKRAWNEKQAGMFLGVHRQTLATWRFQGRGPVYYKIGRKVIYYEDDLKKFLDQNRVNPEAS